MRIGRLDLPSVEWKRMRYMLDRIIRAAVSWSSSGAGSNGVGLRVTPHMSACRTQQVAVVDSLVDGPRVPATFVALLGALAHAQNALDIVLRPLAGGSGSSRCEP